MTEETIYDFFDEHQMLMKKFYYNLKTMPKKGKKLSIFRLPTLKLRIFNNLSTFGMYHPSIIEIHLKFRPRARVKMQDAIIHDLVHYLMDTLLDLDEEMNHLGVVNSHPQDFWMYLKQFKEFIKRN